MEDEGPQPGGYQRQADPLGPFDPKKPPPGYHEGKGANRVDGLAQDLVPDQLAVTNGTHVLKVAGSFGVQDVSDCPMARRLLLALLTLALLAQGALATAREEGQPEPDELYRQGLSVISPEATFDRRSIIGSKVFFSSLVPHNENPVTVAFTGDTLIHQTVSAAARRDGSPFDFRPMFAPVRHLIGRADLAICHLEVPLSPTSSDLSGFPLFNAPAEVADALAWAGFDGCSTASNHSYDQGTQGVMGTLQVLEDAGIQQAGMVDRITEWWSPTLYRVGGLSIGHVSATYWLNGLRLPSDREWLVQLLDVDEMLAVAGRAKTLGADLVVVSMHCCTEYRRSPTPQQVELSHRLISSPDVDLVVTHHSHVVGPVEQVGQEFVLHGLGNFLSGQVQSASLRIGIIAMAKAVYEAGEWRFESIEVIPTQVTPASYRIEVLDGDAAQRTLASLNEMGAETSLAPTQPPVMSPAQKRMLE